MSTITQRIPNLLLGISQQPDNRKFPGQLRDSVNAFPDYALGLLKRPGGTSGKWFSILRDAQEKYVAQYDNNTFRVWSLLDGSPRAVDMGSNTGVPNTCKLADTLVITNAGSTLIDGTYTNLATATNPSLEIINGYEGFTDGTYTNVSTTATTGSGTSLTVDITVSGGTITTATINAAGSNYVQGDLLDIDGYVGAQLQYREPSGLTVDLVISGGVVTTATINQFGSNYTHGDVITMADTGTYPTVAFTYEHELKSRLSEYNAAVANTAAKLALLNAAQATYSETLAGQESNNYERLFQIEYYYTPPSQPNTVFDVYMVSGILEDADGNYIVKRNDTIIRINSPNLPDGIKLGAERTNDHPTLAAQGYRIYEAQDLMDATHTPAQLATALAAMNTAQTNYDNAVTAEATAKTNYDAQVTACIISATPSNGYLYGATADDIELLTLNDYTFVLNKAKTVALTADKSAAKLFEAFVVIKVVGVGEYEIFLDGVKRGIYTAQGSHDTADIVNIYSTR
jgi:hypothetical protein